MEDTQNVTTEELHLEVERWALLHTISTAVEKPMIVLSFVWLVLLIVDLTTGLSPLLGLVSNTIWIIFILNFCIEFTIAPVKLRYLRQNWLTALALILPAIRILRLAWMVRMLRTVRAARSINLLRLVTSFNRGFRATGRTLQRRGVGYILVLTILVVFVGAAGMIGFENPMALRQAASADAVQHDTGFQSYSEALWWSAMMMTTVGTEYWPQTAEGRIVGWFLAIYATTLFGYITATLASHFVDQDREEEETRKAVTTPSITATELQALREEIELLRAQLNARDSLTDM